MEIGFWASLVATYLAIIIAFVLLMRTAHNTKQQIPNTHGDTRCTTTAQAVSPVKTEHSPFGQTKVISRREERDGHVLEWIEFHPPIEFDAKDSRDLLSDY